MRIIKEGWIGQKLTCANCGTRIELEQDDKRNIKKKKKLGEAAFMAGGTHYVECPFCRNSISFNIS